MTVAIEELPQSLDAQAAVEAAYGPDLAWIVEKLERGLSVLVDCDKQLVLYLYRAIRQRLRASDAELRLRLLGGPSTDEANSSPSLMGELVRQLQEAIFSGESALCVVIPHLDVLVTTTRSGLSDRAREVLAMIYENPELSMLAFRDPSFELPPAISAAFPAQRSIIGLRREVLARILTQREARKFGVHSFSPFSLYKYVSGLNAVRFRQLMEHLSTRLDFDPHQPRQTELLFRELREMTTSGECELPQVDLERDIGGYAAVKSKLRTEILELLELKAGLQDEASIREIEEIVPKGMLFVGPPGTGKTYFAKAMATALDATVSIVSGPEMKSKWVGESEENLRRVFAAARKSAPAVIVFDELDSFATTRGTYTSSGVEHSMVNQLLTEMDGFRSEELVFVVGTTNFPQSLDPALLRPGRFELQIEIPYPEEQDRRQILELYRRHFGLALSDERLEELVQWTAGIADAETGARYSGDHLYAICRALKREMLRRRQRGAEQTLSEADCRAALSKKGEKEIRFQEAEEHTIAVHEAGHAVLAHVCPHASAIERVSIATGDQDTLGYVLREVRENKYVTTRRELLDDICVLLGGRSAELMVLGDMSVGSGNDLAKATEIARVMVEELGMDEQAGPRVYSAAPGSAQLQGTRRRVASDLASLLDAAIRRILDEQEARANTLLVEHRPLMERLVEALRAKKTLHRPEIEQILGPRKR
ncbi:MAG: AAA family ATPase [Myxococcota bacterium]|nr:AAA family ATPase [Myxococcota bacterium]